MSIVATTLAVGGAVTGLAKLGHGLYRLSVGEHSAAAQQDMERKQALGILLPAGTVQHNPGNSAPTLER